MPETILEPAREIPVLYDVDVVVCGGGTAGVAAAITAGRMGLRVVMVEQSSIPGGMVTHVIRWLTDFNNKGGFAREFRTHLEHAEYCKWPRYNPHAVVPYLDDLLADAQVRHLYMSSVVAPVLRDDRLKGVIIESKSGRGAVLAKVIIDATGDGDVAARAGAHYEVGREGDHACQAASLGHVVANYTGPDSVGKEAFREAVAAAVEKAGSDYKLPYDNWHLKPVPTARTMMYHLIPHVHDADMLTAEGVSDAMVKLRRQATEFFHTIRHNEAIFGGIEFGPFSAIPGIRETRRITCDLTVKAEHTLGGTRFDDGLFLVTYHVDIHKRAQQDPSIQYQAVRPYHIPLRALLPTGLENIMVVGRCIGGEHESLASYRVIANCFAMGEAAAIVARQAVDQHCTVRQVAHQEVVAEMARRGYEQ